MKNDAEIRLNNIRIEQDTYRTRTDQDKTKQNTRVT